MNYHQVKKYLEGKVTPEEAVQIRNWIIGEENDAELRKILGEIWTNSEIRLKGQTPDFERILNQVHSNIDNQKIINAKTINLSSRVYQICLKVAAILVLPLLVLSIYFYQDNLKNSSAQSFVAYREIYTKPGTRTQIDLSDGTRVWLNDGTTFRYPEHFVKDTREVYVDGEAYFEVKSNTKNPFIVKNPLMNTVVTGTHFNIHAYSTDNYFEATLLEGKINLKNESRNLIMNPGEQIQYDAGKEKIIQKIVDPHNAAAWVKGKLIFQDEKLEIAIRKLARWYNVDIILSTPGIGNYLLTGTIQDEKLDQSLKLIATAIPIKFEYKKERNKTEIKPTIYLMKK